MIPDPIDDGQPPAPPARYRERAIGFGWEVCDTAQNWRRVATFWESDFRGQAPSAFLAAHEAAKAEAKRLNDEARS